MTKEPTLPLQENSLLKVIVCKILLKRILKVHDLEVERKIVNKLNRKKGLLPRR